MAGSLVPGQVFSGPGQVDLISQTMIVLPGTIVGDFTLYLAGFDIGTHEVDLIYDPFVGIPDLWTVTGSLMAGEFAFALETLSIDFQSASQLDVSGNGTLTHPDFDDTPFAWAATFQSLTLTGSFSASTQQIPEPSSFLLAAMALCGLLGFVGRQARRGSMSRSRKRLPRGGRRRWFGKQRSSRSRKRM